MALVGGSVTFTGCVTTQQYESLQSQLDEAESENAALRLARQDSDITSRELEGKLVKAQTENGTLQDDVNRLDREVKHMKEAEADKEQCAEGGEPDKAEEPQVVAAADCVAEEDAEMVELLNATIRLAVVGRTRRA
mgnify:CR=1 FL=1